MCQNEKHKEFSDRWIPARVSYIMGNSVREIAKEYGLSTKAMRTRIHRFRKKYGWFRIKSVNGWFKTGVNSQDTLVPLD